MTMVKAELLEKCHNNFLEMCFSDFPLEKANNLVSEKITGYGTNVNEKIHSLDSFVTLLKMQRSESAGIDMRFERNPIIRMLLAEGNAAIFVDEAKISMIIEGNQLKLQIRVSSVYEYSNDQWLLVHFHGSLPQGVEGDNDTWTVNEWKQKNETLEKIILERTEELRLSMEHLRSTQSQLIQSEKMASLGELTAGIAHEIQNPLNFVNNFSEVSTELVDEMNGEIDNGNTKGAKEIAADLKQNLEKINHHGKRAGDIVKGMLQHSRSSSGVKAPTDINALCDEYLRLAYHGLRAKDKTFNATMKTEFDNSLEKVNIIPQDIGRVVLNLITNAFYAVTEKKSTKPEGYEPTITVSTKSEGDKLLISVRDNGSGIPDTIKEKIFQPFFTTKPTGQGTGLGLSLSYDIVKGHGGELSVHSMQGEGSTFIVQLPI